MAKSNEIKPSKNVNAKSNDRKANWDAKEAEKFYGDTKLREIIFVYGRATIRDYFDEARQLEYMHHPKLYSFYSWNS
jgi:hypothetical protein